MKKKIMMVDDDYDLLQIYVPVLEKAGFEVATANSAAEGLELFRTFLPDLVMVDLAMEHFDSGFVLCHRIKSTPEGAHTPVVIMTAASHETGIRFSTQTAEERKWIQADEYLDKPIPARELLAFIKERFFATPAEPHP
ncbi:MAG TPA: response regulator [bacterium]|nr:response regulator [bacterium]HQG46319.1 response regulator [bacterium]HQI49329.1 response regulator [bacterium]HQJ64695.1 response regulator [bacterium]